MPNKSNTSELSKNEEDYLKALFHLTVENEMSVGTNQLASFLGVTPASVNGMLKKLKAKVLVDYEKYGKLELSQQGKEISITLLRKHRLWETFLYEHMNFSWDEVHDVAEQLEHIRSPKLIAELDRFLGHPSTDPHGDVIPSAKGEYEPKRKQTLSEMKPGTKCRLTSVKDGSVAFLQYVTKLGLELKSDIQVKEVNEFDHSMTIAFDGKEVTVSRKFADNVFVVRS